MIPDLSKPKANTIKVDVNAVGRKNLRKQEKIKSEQGNVTIGFLMTTLLLITVFLCMVQLALILHQKTVLIDLASESARAGARYGNDAQDVKDYLEKRAGKSQRARIVKVETISSSSSDILVVTLQEPYALLGVIELPQALRVKGHAVVEQ